MNVRLGGDATRLVTVRVTGTDTGLLPAPGAVIVMVSEYVPAPRLSALELMAAVSDVPEAPVVPLKGLTVSQFSVAAAVKLRLPPGLVSVRLWGAGSVALDIAKAREDGLGTSGGLVLTTRVTGMVWVGLETPLALIVMLPEYVPAVPGKEDGWMATVRLADPAPAAGVVPATGVTASQPGDEV